MGNVPALELLLAAADADPFAVDVQVWVWGGGFEKQALIDDIHIHSNIYTWGG
jgi:hypothetical protein